MKSTDEGMVASAAVEQIIQTISNDSTRLKAKGVKECFIFQNNAAQAMGYEPPYTAEQQAMNTILTEFMAGNACCEYAWQQFHKLTTGA